MSDHPSWLLKRWDSGQPFMYKAFAVCGVLVFAVTAVYSFFTLNIGELLFVVAILVIATAMAAFQFLSYRITLSRGAHGRLLLHKRRYLVSLTLWAVTVSLAKYDEARTDWHGPSSSMAWRILTDDERQDIYILELYSRRDGATMTVYRGPDESVMKDLADVLREHGGLTLTRK